MKLAVIGSRSFCSYEWLEQCLLRSFRVADIEAVISGGARGADALAARFASCHGIPLIILRADWKTHGKKAGPIRNSEIVAQADAVAAFWDGSSAGTRDTIAKARAAGRRVFVFPLAPGGDQASEPGEAVSPAGRKSPERRRQLLFSDLLFPDRG
jgi:predicted Rossmann fold nucleotide-binding protein DprA/Smf involved in DNA uptake